MNPFAVTYDTPECRCPACGRKLEAVTSVGHGHKPKPGGIRDRHLLRSDVKARRDKMVGLVETMRITADGLQLAAYAPGGDEMRVVEELPEAKTPLPASRRCWSGPRDLTWPGAESTIVW